MKTKNFNIISILITAIATSITFTFKSESLTIAYRFMIMLCLLCALFGAMALRYYVLYFQVKLTVDSLNDRVDFLKIELTKLDTCNKNLEVKLTNVESELASMAKELKNKS